MEKKAIVVIYAGAHQPRLYDRLPARFAHDPGYLQPGVYQVTDLSQAIPVGFQHWEHLVDVPVMLDEDVGGNLDLSLLWQVYSGTAIGVATVLTWALSKDGIPLSEKQRGALLMARQGTLTRCPHGYSSLSQQYLSAILQPFGSEIQLVNYGRLAFA